MNCPHCGHKLKDEAIASEAAKLSAKKRKTFGSGAGRPLKLTACGKCGRELGARAMRKHEC